MYTLAIHSSSRMNACLLTVKQYRSIRGRNALQSVTFDQNILFCPNILSAFNLVIPITAFATLRYGFFAHIE